MDLLLGLIMAVILLTAYQAKYGNFCEIRGGGAGEVGGSFSSLMCLFFDLIHLVQWLHIVFHQKTLHQ